MSGHRDQLPPKVRAAEDSQPNEARGLPKGAGVPVVRPITNPWKHRHPHHLSRGNGGGGWRGERGNGGSWRGRTPQAAGEHTQPWSKKPIPQAPRAHFNEAPNNFTKPPKPAYINPEQHPPNPPKRLKLDESTADAPSPEDAPKPKKAKKPRNRKIENRKRPPIYEWQTTIVDAPEYCKKGAPNSAKARSLFMSDYVRDFRSNMGAVIKEFSWKEDQLVIMFGIQGEEVKESEAQSIPSGSNVMLEDLPLQLETAAVTKIQCDDFDDSGCPSLKKRPSLSSYRPFKSGVLTLTYGLPRAERADVQPELPLEQHEDTEMADVATEVPDIIDLTTLSEDDEQPNVADDANSTPSRGNHAAELPPEQHPGRPERKSIYITENGEGVPLTRHNNDKPRRILVSEARNRTYVLSMHGRLHETTRSSPRQQKEIPAFESAGKMDYAVDDACILSSPFDYLAVVGQTSEDNALTLVNLSDTAEQRSSKLPRTSLQPDRLLRGVSAVHPITSDSEPRFITGGYDRAIELWTVDESLRSAVSVSLTIHHHSTIYSLTTLKDTSQKVVSSGADCIVNIWDLASERTIKSLRTSNMVYHVHATERPGCVLYEVAHRDSQFELHDYRAHLGRPSLRFGFITSAVNGRYMKGDIRGNTFVSGDRNGNIRHWDLRNVREPLQNIEAFPGQKIVQTVFDGDALAIVPEDNSLLFLNVKEGE